MNRILHKKEAGSILQSLPQQVISRARSAGKPGEMWLANLDDLAAKLEKMWHISIGSVLCGGSHALVAYADGRMGEKYVLKIDMPEDLGGDFACSMAALRAADGNGYVRLYAYDPERKACLMERMGKPVDRLGYSVEEQLKIICTALQESWKIPVENKGLALGNTDWFVEFIGEVWEKLEHPCSEKVIEQAFSYLRARAKEENPAEFVLVHGDPHGSNVLKMLDGGGFKLIDPDGLFYEKAYDLGVLMREWVDDYEPDPLKRGNERCEYLHRLTGVPRQAIWEWGFIQTVSTAFVLLQIGQEETGHKMLHVAEKWAAERM